MICFSGFLGLISFLNGRIVYSYFNDISFCTLNGKIIADGKCRRIRGRVISFTKELCDSNVITVDIENGEDIGYAELTGKFIDIENDKIRNAFYEIKSASRSTDGKWTLGIGDVTFIRGLSDIYHPEKGYIYDICENAGFTIPLSCESVYIS
ncbi:hypothetical protein SDC9_157743 [bioreactor metagenome]|uniref:Uncharacterized protein n=1 Tax=bioreactor metagenome TaxID=1076179 RepID=A0A645F7X2_9ZZZZ